LAVVSDFKPTFGVSFEVDRVEIVPLDVVAIVAGICLVKFFMDLDFLLAVLTGLATTGVISLSGKGCYLNIIKINSISSFIQQFKMNTYINYFYQLVVT
jgi:hypothetical protein